MPFTRLGPQRHAKESGWRLLNWKQEITNNTACSSLGMLTWEEFIFFGICILRLPKSGWHTHMTLTSQKKAKIVPYPARGLFEFSAEDAVQSMSTSNTQGLDSVWRALPHGSPVWIETEDTFGFQGLRSLLLDPGWCFKMLIPWLQPQRCNYLEVEPGHKYFFIFFFFSPETLEDSSMQPGLRATVGLGWFGLFDSRNVGFKRTWKSLHGE